MNIINSYFRRFLFLFLPSVCNANCYFCYIKPKFSEEHTISKGTIYELRELFKLFNKLGFKEIRFTGGEPLIFNNINDIFDIVKDSSMRYNILTNGMKLMKYIDYFVYNKPNKIVVSIHTIKNQNSIYRVNVDLKNIMGSLEKMLEQKINVAISILMLPENEEEILELVKYFYSFGIREFKIQFPNMKYMADSKIKKYKDIIMAITGCAIGDAEIRVNDFKKFCLLNERGFLSLKIPEFELFNCCLLVSQGKNYNISTIKIQNIMILLNKIYEEYAEIRNLPCKSYMGSCPLSLKSMEM